MPDGNRSCRSSSVSDWKNFRVRILPRRQDSLTNENIEYWVHTILAEIWPPTEVVWHHIPSYYECRWCVYTVCTCFICEDNQIQITFNGMFVVVNGLNHRTTWIYITLNSRFWYIFLIHSWKHLVLSQSSHTFTLISLEIYELFKSPTQCLLLIMICSVWGNNKKFSGVWKWMAFSVNLCIFRLSSINWIFIKKVEEACIQCVPQSNRCQ